MKTLIVALLALTSTSAFADQCELVSPAQAAQAKLLLQPGAEVSFLCEKCGETLDMAKFAVVRSTKDGKSYSGLQGVTVNGKEIDLAYTFIKVSPGTYVNMAKVVGCEATGVSNKIRK